MVTATAGSNAGGIILGAVVWAVAVIGYLLPVIVAGVRGMPNTGSVAVIDLLLGWTVIGWIVALAMACGGKPPRYAPPPGAWYPPAPRR